MPTVMFNKELLETLIQKAARTKTAVYITFRSQCVAVHQIRAETRSNLSEFEINLRLRHYEIIEVTKTHIRFLLDKDTNQEVMCIIRHDDIVAFGTMS